MNKFLQQLERHALRAIAAFLIPASVHGQAWRSTLYPNNWQSPGATASFYNDKLIQDFSYAGYMRSEEPIPVVVSPVFDVTAYGADPTGATDSTVAIQGAIDAAAVAGGGVVYLPAGEFRVSPQGTNNQSLLISSSNIVLRGAGTGQTFLLNNSYQMRIKAVIRVAPASTQLGALQPLHPATVEITGPTRRIPVENADVFTPGDTVRLEWSFTDAWITENNQQTWWNSTNGRPSSARYLREVVATNQDEGWIEIDVPTRYTMKGRDAASVRRISGMLTNVGIESLSIGNIQHPGTGWGENDYTNSANASYDTHDSWLVRFQNARDGWISSVHSRQVATNSTTCHLLSNGILLLDSSRVTMQNCELRRPQYGGGGGNGYMYRIQNSNECLIRNCIADFSRHGFVISHPGTSGNVFHECEDRETRRATGSTGNYTTNGEGSDNHQFFSHSNLWDQCHAHNSFWTANHRGFAGNTPHGVTSAHAVYWNTTGSGTRYTNIVVSGQLHYGYIIGTSGERSGASNPTTGNTAPADHREGIGTGATLEPASLYLDQVQRRLFPTPILTLTGQSIRLPVNTFTVDAVLSINGQPVPGPYTLNWLVSSAPAGANTSSADTATGRSFTVDLPGIYTIEASGNYEGDAFSGSIQIEVLQSGLVATANFTNLSASGTSVPSSPVAGVNGFTWSAIGSTTFSTPAANMVSGAGNALKSTNSSTFAGMIGTMASTSTIQVGETFKMSFIGQYTEPPENNNTGLRFGFVNPGDRDFAYAFQVGTGGDTTMSFMRDGNNPGDNSPGGGSGTTPISGGSPDPAHSSIGTLVYTVWFSITRTTETSYILTGNVNGTQITATDSSGLGWDRYNAIFIRNGNVNADFQVDNIVVELIPALSTYETWAVTNAPIGNPNDDFDNDGVPNAIEFVLGGSKDSDDRDKLPTLSVSGGDMIFSFVRHPATTDSSVSLSIEVSTDLQTWSKVYTVGSDLGSEVISILGNPDGTDTITLTIPKAPGTGQFARIKVGISP